MALTQVSTGGIKDGTISNADLDASAAIDGSKVSPDFGSQNITTTGAVTGASLVPSSSTVPTNGVYLPAANTVGLSTNDTERLRINSSGRVGIGTTSPDATLHIQDGQTDGLTNTGLIVSSYQPRIILNDRSTNQEYIDIRNDSSGGGAQLIIGYGPKDTYGTRTGEYARFDSSGRLLVGTSSTSSSAIAIVQGNPTVSSPGRLFLTRRNTASNADDELGVLQFADSGHTSAAEIAALRDGATWTSGSDQPTRLVFSTTSDNASSPSERLRISNTGAFGLSGANYGSSGQVLTSQGSGAAPQWATPAGGDCVLLYTINPSGASTVSITGLTSTYAHYMIALADLCPSGNASFILRTSSNNGSTYDSGGSDYLYQAANYQSGLIQGYGATSSEIRLNANGVPTAGGATTGGMRGYIHLINPLNTSSYTTIVGKLIWRNTVGGYWGEELSGVRQSAGSVDAIQISLSSGSFTSGTVQVYGYKA